VVFCLGDLQVINHGYVSILKWSDDDPHDKTETSMSIELGGISAKFNSKIGLVYVPPISRYLVPGQEMDVRDGMHLSTTYQTIGLYIYTLNLIDP